MNLSIIKPPARLVVPKDFPLRKAAHKLFIALFFFLTYVNPVYAIPPPETIAFLGGSLVYPGLLLIGIMSVVLKYIWIKTKLYMVWRDYLPTIALTLILAFGFAYPSTEDAWIKNNPVTAKTIMHWKEIKSKFILIDIQEKDRYDKIHVAGALNFPAGLGLSDYLKNNADKKIVLYCEYGRRSGMLSWLGVDEKLLQQAKNENRLFYFPGGVYQLMRLSKQGLLPAVINLPSESAQYLLKKAYFSAIEFTKNAQALPSVTMQKYQQIIAKQHIPIIRGTQSSQDDIAMLLNKQFNVAYSYFTTPHTAEPYTIRNALFVLTIFVVTLFFIRRSELLQSLFTKPSAWYQWSSVLTSLVMTVPIINLSALIKIPFDVYLYKMSPELPFNTAYLISAYAFFSLVLGAHLLYPKNNRLTFLQHQVTAVFALNQGDYSHQQISWKELFILSASPPLLFMFSIPLPSVFIISVFLLAPFVVDLMLYLFIRLFKNTDGQEVNLLRQCNYLCNPQGTPFILITTRSELSLATIKGTVDNQSIYLGLFTGEIINSSHELVQGSHLKEITLKCYASMVRSLLLLFQQDIDLILDSEHTIISIKLHHNHLESNVMSRHVLLKNYQIFPGTTNEQRFTSLPFQEVFANPTPLLLNVVKQRWSKKGGCITALHKLGLLIKCNDKTQEQFVAFSNQIYIDKTFEQAIFSNNNKLWTWLRKKVVQLQYQLATESILQDYHTLMVPKMQIRLMKLSKYVQQSLPQKKIKRVINRSLSALYKESAMWQCYSSLLHQDAFRQLQTDASNASCQLSPLLQAPLDLPLPSYYELPSKGKQTIAEAYPSESSSPCAFHREAFLNTEYVRTYLRQFQLKEWQLISLLLDQLARQLELPISLSYLTMTDLRSLPKKRGALIELLETRYKTWNLHNQYPFPSSFSLREMETMPLNSTEQKEEPKSASLALRVSGNQSVITGSAVLFTDNLKLETLAKHHILIADNLTPEQIVSCQHIKAIILRKGGYLSHSAIIAREKNIAMIAQFQTSSIKNNAKLVIQAGNQVTILSPQVIDWDFLESLDNNTEAGNKAQRLAIMSKQGFNLPESIVLKHQSIEAMRSISRESPLWQDYYDELKQLFDLVALKQTTIIVRSSTNVEDSADYSYAGIFYSQANINSVDEFIAALCAAWDNMMGRRTLIKEYSGETQLTLNLIVQPYIKGQAGGVLFTESNIPGLMRIEIAAGGIEGVTEGTGSLISLNIDELGQTFQTIGEKDILNTKQYRDLYQLGHKLEVLFGKAQDIEWIIADQQLYVVQSRDIKVCRPLLSIEQRQYGSAYL